MKHTLALLSALLLAPLASLHAATYYGSPSGGGDGQSAESPFQVVEFFKVAKPGDTLVLRDGRYSGDASMILPPRGLAGGPGRPITVKAEHDGAVEIDGENARRPVKLDGNDWFVLEGFDAHAAGPPDSSASVVELTGSSHCIVRRVVGWDATDGNSNIMGTHHSEQVLFEDCAGFGIARKIFSNSQGGNDATFRRCFGRWEGNHTHGPKMTFTLAYESYDGLYENRIATWDSLRMKKSYSVTDYQGRPIGPMVENYDTRSAGMMFSEDRAAQPPNARLLGSIAFLKMEQRFHNNYRVWFGPMAFMSNGIEIRDCVSVIEQPAHQEYSNVYLQGGEPSLNKLTRVTLLGGKDNKIPNTWTQADVFSSKDGAELTKAGGNILDPSMNGVKSGATILNRYVDGRLTSEPLWPWPMNDRILAATRRYGHGDPLDVTRTVFELCGGTLPKAFAKSSSLRQESGTAHAAKPASAGGESAASIDSKNSPLKP